MCGRNRLHGDSIGVRLNKTVIFSEEQPMSKLSAKFKIDLEFPIIIECIDNDEDQYLYSIEHGEYSICIVLVAMDGSPKSGFINSDLYKRLIDRAHVIVTKVVSDIPEIPLTEQGGRDFTTVSQYFRNLTGEYSEIAKKYYKNFIRIVKYDLKQPFHNEESINKDYFSNPSWSIEGGDNIGTVGYIHHVQPIPGMDGNSLGARPLKIEQQSEIENKLKLDQGIELYQNILSDAQAAVFGGDVRRAIFEMAIVCELFTKRKYFSEGGIAGLAFDYFEEKGKVKVSVMELITSVAEEALGESFKAHSITDCMNINYLFRCRNKVAHRGKVLFKDDGGNIVYPDLELIKEWFKSVEVLVAWLSSK